ncbi:hypothetical protein CSKR_201068 [Clonorchis sinensis]|uniref:Uncharacterized protein n=1 Tax=Clonorchis sinensis TaxID=79923 RepID=A0A8T1MLL8_CLOSI|nr:hypothetical protein CSKR_201068 [Clonorchis sinensis]
MGQLSVRFYVAPRWLSRLSYVSNMLCILLTVQFSGYRAANFGARNFVYLQNLTHISSGVLIHFLAVARPKPISHCNSYKRAAFCFYQLSLNSTSASIFSRLVGLCTLTVAVPTGIVYPHILPGRFNQTLQFCLPLFCIGSPDPSPRYTVGIITDHCLVMAFYLLRVDAVSSTHPERFYRLTTLSFFDSSDVHFTLLPFILHSVPAVVPGQTSTSGSYCPAAPQLLSIKNHFPQKQPFWLSFRFK